jgi:protein CpxP
MRFISDSLVFGAVLMAGFSGNALLAQDQAQPQATAPSSSTMSPDSRPGEHRHTPNPHHQAKRMAKKLGLTEDQRKNLEPILADRVQQMQSARADTSLAPQDRMTKIKSINQDSDARIEAMLNDTQKQQYEQMKQNHHGHHHHHDDQQTGSTTPNS